MHKRVLVADLQPGDPPFVHVGMLATMVGHMDRPPAAKFPLITVVEILQPMQIVQIPGDRSVFAVDFKGVESLVAAGVAR